MLKSFHCSINCAKLKQLVLIRCQPDIFNASLTFGIFPEDWKCAKVTPIFKQGARNELNDYRPIFVIFGTAKIFERIIYDQLYAYMIEHDLMIKHQSGFRSLHSTITTLLEASDT